MGGSGEKPCTSGAALIFVVGLLAGTGCIICSKALFQLEAPGLDGKVIPFKPAVFQTWVMFFGMLFALPLYVILEFIRTYQAKSDPALKAQMDREPKVTFKMLMVLGVPAIFDLSSVLLMVAGLMHIDASMWMLLRGGGIVFVAVMKQFALGDRLSANMWWGVLIIALAVALVGCSSMLNGHPKPEDGKAAVGPSASDLLVGISLTIAGTFMQSLQYVYEEKVMTGSTAAPPWLLIGMEGFFGTLICTVVVYPLAGIIPGNDHGCIEYLPNTIAQIQNSVPIQQLAFGFCTLVFILNSFSVLVTFMLSSVWHAILDNFRPITIWGVELYMYYSAVGGGGFGEPWQRGSLLQLAGLGVMLVGTAVYNGSLSLPCIPKGEWLLSPDATSNTSHMASPVLTRSPLVTGGAALSPIVPPRPMLPVSDPMARGDKGSLRDQLLPGR